MYEQINPYAAESQDAPPVVKTRLWPFFAGLAVGAALAGIFGWLIGFTSGKAADDLNEAVHFEQRGERLVRDGDT